MQKSRYRWELEVEREKLKLQQEKDSVKISTQKKLSELLKTEAGRIAALPEEMFGYLLKELEVRITDDKERQKLYREFLRTSQSFQAGQFNAMRALLTQQFGFRFSEESPMFAASEEAKEAQQINGKSTESSQTPEVSDEETNSE